MGLWKPPSTQQEKLTRSVRSMINGTLDGRVVAASPVRRSGELLSSDSEADSADDAPNLVPHTDQFRPGPADTVIFNLTYVPYDDPSMGPAAVMRASIHIYWEGLLQPDLSYSLVGKQLVVGDLSGQLRPDDIITVKYWYDADYDQTVPGPSISGNLCTDPHPDDFHNWVGGPLGGGGGAFNGFVSQSTLYVSDGLYAAYHGGPVIGTYLSIAPNGNSSQIVDTSSPLALNLGTYTRAYDVVTGGVLTYQFKVFASNKDIDFGWARSMYEVFDSSGTRLSVTGSNHARTTDVHIATGETKTISGTIDFTDVLANYPTATCVAFIENTLYVKDCIAYVGSCDVRVAVE